MMTTPFGKPISSNQTDSTRFGKPKTFDINGVEITSAELDNRISEKAGSVGIMSMIKALADPLNPQNLAELQAAGQAVTSIAVETAKDVGAALNVAGQANVPGIGIGVEFGKLKAAGVTGEITEEEQRALRGAALIGAVTADIALGGVSIPARAALAQFTRGGIAGALYALIDTHEEDASLVEAIATDAAIFGGLNLAGAGVAALVRRMKAGQPVAFATGPEEIAAEHLAKLRDDAVNFASRGSETLRAEAIAQTREVPAVLGGTLEQLKAMESQRAVQGIAELKSLQQSMADGTSAKVALVRLEKQGIKQRAATGEGLLDASHAAGEAGKVTEAKELLQHYVAIQEGKKGFGKTVQESLDNLANQTASNQGAGTRQLEKLIASERGSIEAGFEPLIPKELGSKIRIVEHPRDLFLYGRYVAPPHTWAKIHPIAGTIQNNAVERRLVQDRTFAEWKDLISRTKKDLPKKDRVQLGELLNSHIRGEDLPSGTPDKLANFFGEWRARLTKDRKELTKVLDAPPDWGIDAYFMHVFVGDWQVVNAATGGTFPGGFARNLTEATRIAKDMLAKNPEANVVIRPKNFTWEQDAATELGSKAYQAFIGRASKALELSRDDIKGMLSGVTKPNTRKKFFGAAEKRESNLPGFLDDPTDAAAVYSQGLARKLAFHDYEQVAKGLMEKANLKRDFPILYDALDDYVARVLGRQGAFERGWNASVDWAFSATPIRSFAGGQTFKARNVSATVRRLESMWRLGYSPLSAFVNMSQTLVNTSSKIGYKDTAAATMDLLNAAKFGGNKQFAKEIDGLLVEMGIEYAVPLSAVGDAFGSVHKVAPWSPLYLFNKAENINRSIAGLAGYRRYLRANPGDHAGAVKAGKQLSDQMNFIYSVEDLPAILSGPAGQALGQFKPFLVNELHFIAGLRGAEIPRFVANLTAAGGVGALMSLPGLNLLDVLGGELFGERPSEFVKKKAPRTGRGILGLLGFDAEQSVAINSIMAGRSFAGEGTALQEVVDIGLGPGAKDAAALAILGLDLSQQVISRLVPGARVGEPMAVEEKARWARQLMPVAGRRMLDAYRVARDGVVVQPTTGRPIFTPVDAEKPLVTTPDPFGPGKLKIGKETLLQATGFRSLERAEAQRELNVTRRIADQLTRDRRAIVKDILEAQEKGDGARASQLRRDARARGIVITNETITRARDEKRKFAEESMLQRIPKRLRREIEERVRSTLPALNRRRP